MNMIIQVYGHTSSKHKQEMIKKLGSQKVTETVLADGTKQKKVLINAIDAKEYVKTSQEKGQ